MVNLLKCAIQFELPGKVRWTTTELLLWSTKWKNMVRREVWLECFLCPLVSVLCTPYGALLAQIPRTQKGKNKYQKASIPDFFCKIERGRNQNRCYPWYRQFRKSKGMCCCPLRLGLYGGVQIQGSSRQLWTAHLSPTYVYGNLWQVNVNKTNLNRCITEVSATGYIQKKLYSDNNVLRLVALPLKL